MTTGFSDVGYEEFPLHISDLMHTLSSYNKNYRVTIRGDHRYKIKVNERGGITDRDHISSSWIQSAMEKMSSMDNSKFQPLLKHSTAKDYHGEMISDILCIQC